MLLPSGDQTGAVSSFASNVKRVETPRASSISQSSGVFARGSNWSATCFSSGEKESRMWWPASPHHAQTLARPVEPRQLVILRADSRIVNQYPVLGHRKRSKERRRTVTHLLSDGKWRSGQAQLNGVERLSHQTPTPPKQQVARSGGGRCKGGVGRVSEQACRVFGAQFSGEDTASCGVEEVASVRQENRPAGVICL